MKTFANLTNLEFISIFILFNFNSYIAGIDYRRHILTSIVVRSETSDSADQVDPRTERVKIYIMAVNPQHTYSNETERVNLRHL